MKIQNDNVKGVNDLSSSAGLEQLIHDSKIYVSANSLNKQLSQAIVDGDIGGSSGSNLINYISNSLFEYNLNGWVIAKNTTSGSSPDLGYVTSGVSNTLTRQVSKFFGSRAIAYLTMNAQGDFLYTEISAPQSSVYKTVNISFNYSFASIYTDNSLGVYIHDLTNNTMVKLGDVSNSLLSGNKFSAIYQLTDSVNYRLLLFQQLPSSNVIVRLGNFFMGTDNFSPSTGPVVLSLGGGSNPGVSGVAEKVENFTVVHDTQGLYNSSDKKIYFKENGYYSLNGIVYFHEAASAALCINTLFYKINGVQQPDIARIDSLAVENQNITIIPQGITNDFYAKAGDYIELYTFQNSGVTRAAYLVRASLTKVPSQPTSVGNGKVTLVNIFGLDGQSIAHTADEATVPPVVQFSQATIDTDSLVTLNTGRITFKEGGYYKINGKFGHSRAVNINYAFLVHLRLNGISYDGRFVREDVISSANNAELSSSGNIIMQVKAGDYITFTMFQNSGGSVLSYSNRITVEKVTPPVALGVADTISARYITGSGQSLVQGAYTVLNFETKEHDYKNNVTTGANWRFNVTENGLYSVKCNIGVNETFAVGDFIDLILRKNGVIYSYFDIDRITNAVTHYFTWSGSTDLRLIAGDYIDMVAFGGGSNLNLSVDTKINSIAITKIGNY